MPGTLDEVRIYGSVLDPGDFNLPASATSLQSVKADSEVNVTVAPNPVRQFPVLISVSGSDIQSIEVEIFSIAGVRIYASKTVPGHSFQWDGRMAESGGVPARGIYIAYVQANTSTATLYLPPVQLAIMASQDLTDVHPLSTAHACVLVSPNPTRTDTIRFTAQGAAARIRVSIYSASGELVYNSGWASGDEVAWDLRTITGDVASAGPYIYVCEPVFAADDAPILRGVIYVAPPD